MSLLVPFLVGLLAAEPDQQSLWAFRPALDSVPPTVRDPSWPRGGLDRFILSALETEGLRPTKPASPRTLLRRVTFDLTGLPPTRAEMRAFLGDTRPGAYERVVDRLLASPRYGERWGRHWLDVARYADSNGLDENIAHGNAWRYRDYVIHSFNEDLAYDRFLTEQLAGDLLTASDEARRAGQLIATGFLSLGPKVLAEGDVGKLEMDIIDEQVDTLGRAFLGLTLGCARCHDHKFDPIRAQDYYALAGIFKSTRTMESLKRIARWNENSLASRREQALKEDHDRQVAALETRIARHEKGEARDDAPSVEDLREQLASLKRQAPVLPSAMGVCEGEVSDLRVHVRGSHLELGEAVERGVPAVFRDLPQPAFDAESSGRRELADWLVAAEHPLTARVLVNRVWRWHFGTGLVATPDNFGVRGERPSHPELLDWLAHRLIEGGWSIKKLHRLLLTSSTYRQGSRFDETAGLRDPQNRLWWRFPLRRLEAEAIRDALLAVAGVLDLTMGGSLLPLKNRQFVFDHTSKDATRYDSHRRSVYLPVIRNHVYDFFALFDYPDPSVLDGDRATTTVPSQALLLLNSDFAAQLFGHTARRLLAATSPEAGVRELYERAFGRPATEVEVSAAMVFSRRMQESLCGDPSSGVAAAPAGGCEQQAWEAFCQVLLLSNEFLYTR